MRVILFIFFSLLILNITGCASTSSDTETADTSDPHTPPAFEVDVPKSTANDEKPIETLELSPTEVDDVWQRIRIQLSFAHSEEKSVQDRINWYLKHPNYMELITKRAEPFLYYIVNEVERRGLPIELALMPLIESDFNSRAYSNKHASGLWQLTPLIAKHYGVKMNAWYDGRHDIVESTNAALNFLSYLHKRFDGNWYHAIAAYNTGEGRVARAISYNKRKGKPTDFFSLKIPRETRHYVPKLLAASQLLKEQQMHFPIIVNKPTIDIVDRGGDLILDDSTQWTELRILNPGYRRYPALIAGAKHIVLRQSQQESWQQYLVNAPTMPNTQWQKYTIRRGDSLSKIAKLHDISIAELKTFNQLKSNKIRAGDTLVLPVLADKQIEYRVKSGDSLWRIARHFNVTVNKLKQWNGISKNHLDVGDTLTIFIAAL